MTGIEGAAAVASVAVAVSVVEAAVSAAAALRGVGSMLGSKSFLTNSEKVALEKRIADIETGTRAEIMTVIAKQSDGCLLYTSPSPRD